ncbi:MAG TPA: NAD-dependent deacylase [Bryobacteraceae bacterium]|jgi:NAD-dependent deacetylase|nr:NAD-dependent deacylase [Bryobacteraceae bacterium]
MPEQQPFTPESERINLARTLVRRAQRIAALTGAGISAESGVPTFRGAAGLWKQFRPEELATPQAFRRDPALVWKWYDWRRSMIAQVKPNPGHAALATLERRANTFTLITQNVDGLHQQAGSEDVLEVHGSIWRLRCTACSREWLDRTVPLSVPPHCECGAMARPAVVWFGEALPPDIWSTAEQAVSSCDLLLVIGTSAVVYPAAGLVPLARGRGTKIVEVNIQPTAVSSLVDYTLAGPAGELLPQLL